MNPIDPVLRYWLNNHLRGNALELNRASLASGRMRIVRYSPIGFPNWTANVLRNYHPHRPAQYLTYYIDYWGLMNGK